MAIATIIFSYKLIAEPPKSVIQSCDWSSSGAIRPCHGCMVNILYICSYYKGACRLAAGARAVFSARNSLDDRGIVGYIDYNKSLPFKATGNLSVC